jgi:hypothetical protein
VPFEIFSALEMLFLNGTCCLASCVNSVSNDRVHVVA